MITIILIFLVFFFLFTTYILYEKTKDYIEDIDKLNTTLLNTSRKLYTCQENIKKEKKEK
jgi:sensor histidine kinase regulating citrate/malate metabolism